MPGTGCVVPNCKSSYKREGKVHLFRIPQNEEKRKKWIEVIPGKNKYKIGQVVCSKHFLPDDIVRKREVKDPEGKVMASEVLKKPHLKKDAVPSLFHNCSDYLLNTLKTQDSSVKREAVSEPRTRKKIKIDAVDPVHENSNANEVVIRGLIERQVLFDFLFKTKDYISLPASWCYRYCERILPCIELTESISRIAEANKVLEKRGSKKDFNSEPNIQFVTRKQLIIYNDMRIQANILGAAVSLDKLGLTDSYVSSVEELESLVKKFHDYEVDLT